MHARDGHPGPIGGDAGEGGLTQRDLARIAGQKDQGKDAEAPDQGQRSVELESLVEADGQAGQNRESDDRNREADDVAGHHFATPGRPRGERTMSTARITRRAIKRGNPSDCIQIVG